MSRSSLNKRLGLSWRQSPPIRRMRAIGWPAMMLIGFAFGFWLLWPKAVTQAEAPRRKPEAGAAYVLLDVRHALPFMKPDLFARPSHLGFASALPDRLPEYPVEPHLLSPPRYLEPDTDRMPPPSLVPALPAVHQSRLDWSLLPVAPTPAAYTAQVDWALSPSLASLNLAFQAPPLPSAEVWRVRLFLSPSAIDPGGVRLFVEAQGLEADGQHAWQRWAQETFATQTNLNGYIDFFPVRQRHRQTP